MTDRARMGGYRGRQEGLQRGLGSGAPERHSARSQRGCGDGVLGESGGDEATGPQTGTGWVEGGRDAGLERPPRSPSCGPRWWRL